MLLGVPLVFARGEAPRKKYEPTWESLNQHQTPEWLMDAKLGFKIQPPHPTEAEYQAYWARRGEPNKQHLYGAGAWDQTKWDPGGLAELAVDMGARYQPVTLWFDGERMSDTAEKLKNREFLAWYYNQASNPDELAAEDGLGRYKLETWHERLVHGGGLR